MPDRGDALAGGGEWDVDRLDLAGYLRRIDHDGDLEPTPSALRELHRAHLAAIAFENLDIVLGRGIDVELGAIQAKLVERGRGGYCYEHNLLFAAALERLGFTVERRLARVGAPERPRARTHMVLLVRADGARWLADVGFGSGLLEPLPLAARGPQAQEGWRFALTEHAPGVWELRERQAADEWVVAYRFDDQHQHPADVLVANHFTSTHPRSPFVRRAVAVRKEGDAIHRLLGRAYTITRPDWTIGERELDDRAIADALHDVFNIHLAAAELDGLLQALPPAAEGAAAELPRAPDG